MRRIFLIIAILVFSLSYGQKPKAEVLRYTEVTTAERDAFTVPAGEHWRVYNVTTGQNEFWDGSSWESLSGGGGGDMTKAVYDPTNVNGDAFSMDNMAETATKKILTNTERTNLSNQSGTNTGDQDLSGLALKSNVLELDNVGSFTPDADYEPSTKKYVDDSAGLRVEMINEQIDWSTGNTFTHTAFIGTPIVVFTDANLPTGASTETITLYLTGNVTSISFPSYWDLAENASETYDGTKWNQYVIECVNGTVASETVYYSNSLYPL